ncbi:MAG: SEC-C metal-binding domain-containing protein [Nocardioidaceae bacterium]
MPETLPEIAGGIRRVLAAGGALTEDELVAALQGDGLNLGVRPEDTVAEVLESDDGGLVMPLGDGRHALLPAMLMGRTFTHRVSAAEVEHGFLNVSPDLEPVSILTEDDTYRRLVDGTALVEVLTGFDDELLTQRDIPLDAIADAAWVLEPDVLRRLDLSEGDLVGVTVRSDGFELGTVTAIGQVPDAGARLADALQLLGDGGPDQIDCVVWLASAQDPGLFSSPVPPLTELFAAAGLVTDGEQLGPAEFDFASWRVTNRLEHIADVHRLDEDSALAVLVLARLYEQVASLVEHAQQAVVAGETLDDLLTDTLAGTEPAAAAEGAVHPDRKLVRETVEFLADPAVVAAVLVETIGAGREGASALGLFAETLEPQAPRSAQPALRWLRGKAFERLGDIVRAEEAYETSLALDSSSPLPLFELARIASDRGDAERGLSLLRRAGAPSDDELVVLLEHFRPTERRDIGRNSPCWCGSGRKYKVCHRNRETLPLTERAAWLYQKAGSYLTDGPWRADAIEVARSRARHWDQPEATYLAIQDPLVGDAVLFEGGAFAAFLDERGVLLPDDERLLAQQWLLAERSVHEIEKVFPGTGFTARDLRTGDRVEVRERTASRTLQPGRLICARLVPAGDTTQCFGGIEPVALHERDDLLQLLDSRPDPDQLVSFLSGRFAPPSLQNTEGDPLEFCEATLHSDDPAALAAVLDSSYDRDEAELRWFEHVTTHGMPRIRATITLDGSTIQVETNSEPRMVRALDALRDLQPGLELLTQTRRPVDDVQEAMSRGPAGEPAPTLDPNDPQIAQALEQMIRAHEQAWLDEPIPALAGVTPREAAADPTRRPDLLRLIDTVGPAGPGAMDADRLRAQLGL